MIYVKEISYSHWNDSSGWSSPHVFSVSSCSAEEAAAFAKNASMENHVGEPLNYFDWLIDAEVNREEGTDLRWHETIYEVNRDDLAGMDANAIMDACNPADKIVYATDFAIESEMASRVAERILATRPGLTWIFGG